MSHQKDQTDSFNQTNRVIIQADMAALAVRALANKSIEVESIQIGGVRPVIWVVPGTVGGKLRHAMYRRETIRGQVHCTYTANELGCQIRWKASGRPDPEPTRARRPALGVAA